MTALAASSLRTQLETAQRNNQRQWIYRSEFVKELPKKLTKDQLYSVFSSEHLLVSATRL